MIITKITGGLGNQMFQYAVAKAIAKKRQDEFKLDKYFYPKQTLRKYELNQFNLEEKIATNDEVIKLAGNENFWFKVKRKIGLNPKRPKSYFEEKEIAKFHEEVFEYQDNIYLDGYWQNEEYFKDIRDEILKDFTLRSDISNEAKKYLEYIKNLQSVSLHVRRGDYVQNSHTNSVHGTCNLKYYQKAIKKIEQNIENPIFYIFSDDIVWCKENFEFLENKVFVDDTENAFDDLELMKNCKHNIIANSSFSWWGAWLNQNENKIVIAPKRWFADDKLESQSKDIICESWVRI
ncbi:alpha-1,2-fucosyltransferase [Aliarcobacter cryaerophilus]|uniref:alpha-1,2-fucosyltransferase n=1 Tax=Aliarcobacter cryaerophilus TaxID=28198 RepID=UPI003DA367A6